MSSPSTSPVSSALSGSPSPSGSSALSGSSASSLRVAGALVTLGALGFVLVFSVLAASFGYPDVLDRPAAAVLPALIGGGASLKAWWILYAILPLFITTAALLAHRHLLAPGPSVGADPGVRSPWAPIVTATGVGAGLAMAVGLVRWSTLQWSLGESWLAEPSARAAIEAASDAANRMLGNGFGEVVGETLLGAWLVGVARLAHVKVVRVLSVVVGVAMIVGAWRFAVPAFEAVTEVTNLALPVGLIALGLTWVAWRRPTALAAALATATLATSVVLVAAPSSHAADPEPVKSEVILHGFRAPSMGVELREDWIGFHVGLYPTILDEGADGKGRTTWFAKTGVTFYPLQLDLGSGRPSGLYIGVALMQGLGNAWDASKSATSGAGGFFDLGFRWAAFKGFDLRLGAGALVGFDGRTAVNFTPGFSWALPL